MTAKQNMHLMQTFGMQLVAMAVMPMVLTSFVPTDWSRFAAVDWTDWLVLFLGLSIGIYFVGNMCTFYSIRNFGASFNSVFLGIRLMVRHFNGHARQGCKLAICWL